MSETVPVLPFIPQDDPVWPLPSVAEMEEALRSHPKEFREWLEQRQEQIRLRQEDPFHHGFEPAIWHVVDDLLCRGQKVTLIDPVDGAPREIIGGSEVYVSGGNRASKTQYAASRVVKKLVAKAKARAWCFHTTGPSSIAMQQPRVWEYLPREWRGLRRHQVADIKYSQKNGFAGITPTFVGPNGSQCWFKNYAQDIGTLEGEELDIAWMDELVPMDYIEAVRFRLATRRGQLVITFTAVDGYTATVKELIAEAKDVLTVPATLLPILNADGTRRGFEKVPRVQQARYEDLKIVYFHIFDNPFGNQEEVISKAKAKGREGIKLRCYGVPTKQIGAALPMFRRDVHVITREAFARLGPKGTNKMYVDPCSGRNWFMIWARALPDEQTIVVYREWPSPGSYIRGVGDPGPWAESDGKKHDGKRGPAQSPWGFGLERYFEEILAAEGWGETEIARALQARDCRFARKGREAAGKAPEEIWSREMDSRFGAAPTLARGETKTLIESMDEIGMLFEPTSGEHLKEGVDHLATLLYYDTEKEIGPMNKPRLLVTENCRSFIWACENWTGLDGPHGACKDPIDLGRYLALSPPVYFGQDALKCRGGGAY